MHKRSRVRSTVSTRRLHSYRIAHRHKPHKRAGKLLSAAMEMPKTPSGEQLSAWMTAFNSGENGPNSRNFGATSRNPEDHKVGGE